ncbi:Uncharacterised protein [Edwardsiella hoshinae]|uniref:Uncharacterized protein n=1 Tax=Edwardsiella hoshinae TaxID=93378 RepID=A0A376J3H6_9GAMM|nr:hypothetical protein [Edwardsiella hoshinae]STE53317.1 Uncharacterised protein [Edwardsiella hoshinae]
MMTEKGSLIYGIEHNGKLHYAFEIGLPTLGQTGECLDATESRFGSLNSGKADVFYRAASFAFALVQLGDIPKEAITPDLLYAQLTQEDAEVLDRPLTWLKKSAASRRAPRRTATCHPCPRTLWHNRRARVIDEPSRAGRLSLGLAALPLPRQPGRPAKLPLEHQRYKIPA